MSYLKAYKALFSSITANTTASSNITTGGVSNASLLQGTTLASNIVNSSLKNLGTQNMSLDMGNNSITNVNSMSSNSVKVSKYRPSYNIPSLIAIYDFSDQTHWVWILLAIKEI